MLVNLNEVFLSFGKKKIFKGVNLTINSKDRICLVGRNGCGKSTLFKLLTKEQIPDEGEIRFKKNLIISQLHQYLTIQPISVYDFVKQGLTYQQSLIDHFHHLTKNQKNSKLELKQLEKIQDQIELAGGWNINLNIETILSELDLPKQKKMNELSGGWQRRVGLAKALVSKPELLLLDEPTNHLDIQTIEWLENRINKYTGAVMFITHDRNFLQNIVGKIIELDFGKILIYLGDYNNHLKLKSASISIESTHKKLFNKKLAEEEVWIRQGIKARRTRNEGRVRYLEQMRIDKDNQIKRPKKIKIEISQYLATGKKVVDLKNIYHNFPSNKIKKNSWLINNFTLNIKRGEKIALVGNNGVGKSTLLKIITGYLKPEYGTIKFGSNWKPVYFDQTQRNLKIDQSISYNICNGRKYIEMNNKSIHVVGYLKNYLFEPERSNELVNSLSGGEKNRVLLASLLARPNNVLILDEPTNDLDLEMIKALELGIKNYLGTVILVSHDRTFIDRVATSCLVFESDGVIKKYFGGYSDWLRLNKKLKVADSLEKISTKIITNKQSNNFLKTKNTKPTKKNQKKINDILKSIQSKEEIIDLLTKKISSEDFNKKVFKEKKISFDKLKNYQKSLEILISNWSKLETQK